MTLYGFNVAKGAKFHCLTLICAALTMGAAGPVPSGPTVARRLAKLASDTYGVRSDPSLAKIARVHAEEVLTDFRSAQRARVKAAVTKEGLADAQIIPFTAVGPDVHALVGRAERFARDQARPRGPTHLGVALTQRGPEWALVAIYSRRTVALPPLPLVLPKRGMRVRGVSRAIPKLRAYLLGPVGARPHGPVRSLEVQSTGTAGRHFTLDLPAPTGRGHYLLQVVQDGSRGPEVAAHWAFRVGKVRQSWPPPAPRGVDNTEQAALGLLHALRDREDLAPLQGQAELQSAARAHAQAMCAAQITAHTLPGGEAPNVRARRAGYEGRVHENVARAKSVAQAHQNLALSPRHRMNLLNATATHIGLAVVAAPAKDGVAPSYCVVQLFGTVSDSSPRPGRRAD